MAAGIALLAAAAPILAAASPGAGGAARAGEEPAAAGERGKAGSEARRSGGRRSGAMGLASRVREPLLYLAHAGGGGAAGRWPWRLLEQDGTLAALGLEGSLQQALHALAALGGDGDVELALTGVGRLAEGRPELVFRAVLQRPRGDLETALRDRAGATDDGVVGDGIPALKLRGTHVVLRADGDGCELVVANARELLDSLFRPEVGTVAGGTPVLARDPDFVEAKRRLDLASGSLLVYADWPRLRQHFGPVLPGVLQPVVSWSGLTATRRIAVGVRPVEGGLFSTVLLDTDLQRVSGGAGRDARRDGSAAAGGEPTRSAAGPHGPAWPGRARRRGPPGWMALLDPAPLGELIEGLPADGIATVTLAIEPGRLIDGGLRGEVGMLLRVLRGSCYRMGLDLERQVLDRLGSSAGLQVVAGLDADDELAVGYSLHAKDRGAAERLFRDVSQALEARDLADVERIGGPPRRAAFRVPVTGAVLHVAVQREGLLFADDDAALDAVLRTRGRGGQAWAASFRRLAAARAGAGGRAPARWAHEPVAGIVALDLQALAASAGAAGSGLFGKHAGIVQLDGTTVRCDLFTEL